MVLDLNIKRKTARRLVYGAGALIEVIGFGLIFKNQEVINYFSNNPVVIGFVLMVGGYVCAVGARKIKN